MVAWSLPQGDCARDIRSIREHYQEDTACTRQPRHGRHDDITFPEQWANLKDVGIWKAGTKGRAPEGTRLMMPSFFG
jgi:hypothetical protein